MYLSCVVGFILLIPQVPSWLWHNYFTRAVRVTTEKTGGGSGDLQLNIGSSTRELQLLCRSEGGPATCSLCMSGWLLEQAERLIVHEKKLVAKRAVTLWGSSKQIQLTTQANLAKDQGRDLSEYPEGRPNTTLLSYYGEVTNWPLRETIFFVSFFFFSFFLSYYLDSKRRLA